MVAENLISTINSQQRHATFSTPTAYSAHTPVSTLAPLANEQSLEFILKYNAPYRSDPAWLKYVNLSISRINQSFFDHAGSWHKDPGLFWVIIGIAPEVLTHDGVYFTTTNNIYPACIRGKSSDAFEKLFARKVLGRYSAEILRRTDHPDHWTTCPQAEVLYPGPVPTKYIQSIYVRNESDLSAVYAQMAALGVQPYKVKVAPEKFTDTGTQP